MQFRSTTLPEKSYLQLLLKSCKISKPAQRFSHRLIICAENWYRKKGGITRIKHCAGRKGGVTCSGSLKPSSYHSSGPTNGSPTTTKHLPTTARLAASSRHGSLEFSDGPIRFPTDSASHSNKTLTSRE
jgi:hypothetical protein